MTTFQFTAFENADLFGNGRIAPHSQFVLPDAATLEILVEDDDANLSGDARRNEKGDDQSGQLGMLTRAEDGAEIGNGGTLYAERVWHVQGDNGATYQLVELEQPGTLPDSFTFLGAVPPAGTILTVGFPVNVRGEGLAYEDLSAGDLTQPQPNIVEIAASSDDFNILVTALDAAGLTQTVADATDITVFAPTDAAFTQLAIDLGFEGDESDEDAVFGFIAGALSDLAPDGDPIPLLTDILLYHVSPGEKTAAEIDAAETIPTLLEGATFATEGTELVDNEPDIDNPNIVAPDIQGSNGNIQVIDRVLLPLDIPGNSAPEPTLTEIVAASGGTFDDNPGDFDLLFNALQAADLAGALDDPDADLTVFAPTDAAFVGLSQALGFEGSDEGAAFEYLVEALMLLNDGDPIPVLTDILLYHVAPGELDEAAVLSATEIETLLGGATLGVDGTSLVDADPDVPNPNLIETDIEASNGIAHAIDGVLLPVDLLQSDGSNDVDFIIAGDARDVIRTGRDNDFVDGNGGNDNIALGAGNDVGFGGTGHDRLFGSGGNDTLKGDAGDDVLRGGAGDDHLTGGTGNDFLFGGRGADVFKFAAGDGHDVIRRFEQGQDKIDLSGTDFASFEELSGSIEMGRFGASIDLGDDQSLFVGGRHLELTADDFVFPTVPMPEDEQLPEADAPEADALLF